MIRFRVIYFTILLCISVLFPSVVLSQEKSSDLNGIWKTSDGGTLITITHKGSSLYAMYLIDKSSALTNSSLENSDDALNLKFNGSVFTGRIHLLYTVKYSQKCHKEWSAVNEFTYDSKNHLFLMDFTRTYIELTLSKDGNKLQGSYRRPFNENNCIIKSPVLENIVFERANISTNGHPQQPEEKKPALEYLEVRFTDDEFNEIDEALILVPELAGSGTGEVWVEVEVPADHPDFDDGMVEVLKVQVTSDIDPEGEVVVCVETAPDSRIFRSQKAIEISIQMGIES